MQLLPAIEARRSIRRYAPGEIPQADLEAMLAAAMLAPSACNTRPWEFFVIRDAERKAQLAACHPHAPHLANAPAVIIVCARPDLQEKAGSGYWPQDCGAAIENLLLQAAALGYGACWCGLYPRQERVEAVQKLVHTAAIPVAAISVGTPAESPAPRGFYDPTRVTFL